ncbi:DUF5114 domain-containing protein [Carboxylicivirga linearis]|uniref:DUF5114 domain-containing protein n=1 Tax=Carboxylicivirga linearis TaxID=1628157 RepID=A0ABS5JUH8_9BACT|nr:DUF5114 domain-containing protein [Carboxylicivirga linearis]MBS2098473.1 DUF5114 domain-containing protein [Carboxylicivirga linearis]
MKKLLLYTALAFVTLFASCEKEGEKLILSGLGSSDLVNSESDVVLTQDNKDAIMLSFTWDESELSLSDQKYGIPDNVPQMILEISDSESFDSYETREPQDNMLALTGGELNTLAKNFSFEAGKSTPMYFRVNAAYGNNTQSYYSNLVTVNITSYEIDMSRGFILDADQVETGFILYSPNSNGNYSGFTGATAWYNWYLKEGDGSIWGNDGVAGTEFLLSNLESKWNFWYPGLGGCYYTTLSTSTKEWTATYIPNLNVTGDVSGDMTFVRSEVKWYISVVTTTDNATVQISTTDAKLYNLSTGTSDDNAITKEIGFVTDGANGLDFEMSAADASDITFGVAGEYTLTLYLDDPTNWYYEITEGSTEVEDPLSEFLYLPGIDDGISGEWTFDNYLRLLSEDDSTFAGVVDVNSLWGYQMSLEKDNWTDVYTMGDTEGTLAFQGEGNIPAPETGLNLIQADLNNLTYSHMVVSGLSYSGFNDDWTMVSMTETAKTGTYAASITINGASEWGGQLYLNGDWDYSFGGTDGTLYYSGAGIADDAVIDAGSYDLIANVIDQSYVLLGDEVYIAGLNDVWDFTSVILTKQSTGVYTGSATVTNGAPWGIAIHLDQSWNRYFGGSAESMTYLGDNMDMSSLANGTYNITVDFINNTCSFQAQ